MARIIARNAKILAGGYDISGRSNSVTLGLTAEAPEVTAFGESTRVRLAGGLRDTEMSVDGFFDSAASQTDTIFSELLATNRIWALYPAGYAASNIVHGFSGVMTEYSSEAGVEDSLTTSVTVTGSVWHIRGLSLGTVATACTASGSAANSSVDFSASSGSVRALVHLMDIATSTIGASLQHSSDDISFTTLIDFGTAGSPSKSLTLSGSGQSASRYRRLRYLVGAGASVSLVADCEI